jgi:hypothetical protein
VSSLLAVPGTLYFVFPPFLRLRLRTHAHAVARRGAEARAAKENAYAAEAARRMAEHEAQRKQHDLDRKEREKWTPPPQRTLAPSDAASPPFFDLYASGTPEQRGQMRVGYENRLTAATARDKDFALPLGRLTDLSREANALFLPAIIGAGDSPLDLAASSLAGKRLVYVGTTGIPDLAYWQKTIPAINAILGGQWRVERGAGTTVLLTGLPNIPERFALAPTMLSKGNLFLGLDLVTGQPHTIPIKRFAHTIVQGSAGVGKSTLMHQLMASVLYNIDSFDHVYLIDLKFGLEANRYAKLSPKISIVADVAEVPTLLTELERVMRDRATDMKQRGSVMWERGRILVVVDECADLFKAKDKRKAGDTALTIEERFVSLAQKARALGIVLWMQAHEATNDGIPLSVRRHLRTIIGFKQPAAQAQQLMGQVADSTPIPFPELKRGQVIYQDGDDGTHRLALQGAFVTFDDVQAMMQRQPIAAGMGPPPLPAASGKGRA